MWPRRVWPNRANAIRSGSCGPLRFSIGDPVSDASATFPTEVDIARISPQWPGRRRDGLGQPQAIVIVACDPAAVALFGAIGKMEQADCCDEIAGPCGLIAAAQRGALGLESNRSESGGASRNKDIPSLQARCSAFGLLVRTEAEGRTR